MLLRGQNLLGYRHYEDGVVNRFVEKSAENGMDVYRVFDALNDVRNVRQAIAAVRRVDKHAQGTICYTESPLHTVEGYVQMARDLMDLGCDSLCIKDMAALLKPQPAYDIVKAIKDDLGVETRVHLHCHSTTGVTLVSLMKAIEAGADVVRCCAARRTAPTSTTRSCSTSRTTSPGSGRSTRSSCRPSPGSRPRSSRARSPAG
jgi:methylmalonyl-CoA carboxyltransferase 5S subunit